MKIQYFEGNDFGKTGDCDEKVSSSSSEMSIDRLSALPDDILIHILSFLGLKESVVSSVLSKRWKFLWTELPELIFVDLNQEIEKIHEFVAVVNKALLTRSRIHLRKFDVCFRYYGGSVSSDVDSWVDFAVKNKVEEVCLYLNSMAEDELYELPETMYSNSSLTRFSVRGCLMDTLTKIEWQSLTRLEIEDTEVLQHVIENILSGCPVLHTMDLDECWGFSCLDIKSQNLKELKVHDREEDENGPLLEISAPYVQTLDISFNAEGRKLVLRNTKSLVRAKFDFNGYEQPNSEEARSLAKEVYEIILLHVIELELGRFYFIVLSELVVNGWQLPVSKRKCLTVFTQSEDKHNISGIFALLKYSPNLEQLAIEGFEPEGLGWDEAAAGDLDCELLHLKSVSINEFADPAFNGEPMQTVVRTLLKRATVLEEINVRLRPFRIGVRELIDFVTISRKLLTYPRSSGKAVVRLD
ncbi:hypothetical protein CASFOL_002721 [Castilleja foliolosa]|uniref:F-box domain-containing protein n=1 Tax=Castilleja foliolosa TaxID=1961234 RepID=A0ABD3EF38_9LAMI